MAVSICPVCKTEYEKGEVFCPLDGARVVSHSQMASGDIPEDPLIGQTLDKYKVIKQIGEGGMGLVYEGLHTVIEKRVAIKLLREDFSSKPDVVTRFRQEAKSASRIGHENIVDISDFGETPTGASYFIMEFLEGEDLANVLSRDGVLAVERAIHIASQCCRALGAAHSKGIVHRDMKPENIFLVSRGGTTDFVKIVDFGIAKMSDIETDGEPGRKLTKTGMIFGTPEYMSPEQAAGKQLDHRVDVYAMGVILYECITGTVPFLGDTFMGILTQHMFEEPPALLDANPHVECPSELEMVIYKALAKDPEDRYQDMFELLEAIEEAAEGRVAKSTLRGHGDPVKATKRSPRSIRPVRGTQAGEAASKNRLPWIFAILLLMVVAGGGAWWVTMGPGAAQLATVPPDLGVPIAAAPDLGPPDLGPPDLGPPDLGPPDDGVPEGPVMVELNVETIPDSASVQIVGSDQTCGPTPCTLRVIAGVPIVLEARRGRSRGELEVTPEGETMTVQMALVRRSGGSRPAGGRDTTTTRRVTGRTTGTMGGDLKVPEIFR